MSLFERPHRYFSTNDVVMGVKAEALGEVDDYSAWVEKVAAELAAVYGEQVAHLSLADTFYSTSDAPTTFSSRISAEVFQRLGDYKAVLARIDDVDAQLAEQMQLESATEAELAAAKQARVSSRQLQRTLRAIKAKVTQLRQETDNLIYERACLSQQLVNVFKAEYVRVSLV
ncbi:hypothetical protein ABB37_00748 [Leptomonas pyrrhocoris]|uniref:Uncharacterized protein n=1 Tax=Leptomonas pyrrhocoris TaxID=157538 RepID=A0A0M9GB22_LEPPY|nr:hypothetical protein ABB37_00748 [Leptomonas pyrrhocoris]KPA86643.1 hypothetical protein ABB37_00748 [Leptomonas pyrrhocoris]|eukprot:XP_015665082.1 hypothetical protein ABB37_00748 [Leptomonas pyrrhocoris]